MARVLFFGRLRDIAGASEMEAPAHLTTLAQLRAHLGEANPALREALREASVRAAIDHVLATGDASIANTREIAFMPPLSGG